MRECCGQSRAEVVSNNKNKVHGTSLSTFSRTLYVQPYNHAQYESRLSHLERFEFVLSAQRHPSHLVLVWYSLVLNCIRARETRVLVLETAPFVLQTEASYIEPGVDEKERKMRAWLSTPSSSQPCATCVHEGYRRYPRYQLC